MRHGIRQSSRFNVAIIGGGFAGATLAVQLLNKADRSLSVALIERGPCRGRGVAYSTQEPGHLLNVPANNMSTFADDPDHFLRWARLNFDSGVQPGDFLPRPLYGQYLQSLLEKTANLYGDRFAWKQDEALRIDRLGGRAEVLLRSGQRIFAGKVVLALGNFPPGDLRLPGKPDNSMHYVSDPWTADALDRIPQDGSILLIGSGLTSVDMVLALRGRGFRGTIHMLSRHGLSPQKHKEGAAWPVFWNRKSPRTARGLLRMVRKNVQAAERQGCDWRAVIDSLRCSTQAIWQSLPLAEQKRFVRHLRPYWDVHRHRIAPEIGRILEHQMRNGNIQVHAGRITAYLETDNAVEVTYRDRENGTLKHLRVDQVINCTGPEVDCRKIASPLLADLLRQNLIRPDQLFLGLDTSNDGALISADGAASEFLYAVGPARKGSLWETIAVPEICAQVSELASLLVQDRRSYEESLDQQPASAYISAIS